MTGSSVRRAAFGLAVAAVIAACLPPPGGRLFGTTLPSPDGGDALPVVLRDETGLVTGIEPAPFDPEADYGIAAAGRDPADPNVLVVRWLGGLCDSSAELRLRPGRRGEVSYALDVTIRQPIGLGCPGAGVPRGVRIRTSTPIPIESIELNGRPRFTLTPGTPFPPPIKTP